MKKNQNKNVIVKNAKTFNAEVINGLFIFIGTTFKKEKEYAVVYDVSIHLIEINEFNTKTYFDDAPEVNDVNDDSYRVCDKTGEKFNEGYCFGDGERYFASEENALEYAKEIGYESLDEAYNDDAYYFSSWGE
jgi:hypothetical protein